MTPTTLAEHDPANQTNLINDLRRRVNGRLTTPEDRDWAAASMAWVVNVRQDPMAVLEVHDADDVIAAVRWAVAHGVQVTAQPTGHGANDRLEQVLLLRTGGLGGVEIDLERRTAWVGAGVKAGELCAELDGTGLIFLCGSNPDPTVVGMTLTGGLSWFARAYGLGSESITAVELVDGLGRLRRVSAAEDPESFWALRGGGGDFGIVTRLEIALHPAGYVYGGQLMWPVERMAEVLTTFRDVTASAPEELSLWFHVWSFPPLPELPEPLRGRSFAGLALTHLGDGESVRESAESLLAPFRAIEGLEIDTLGHVPMSQLAKVAGEPTDPMPGMQRTHLLCDLDADTIGALVEAAGPRSGSPLTVVQVRHLGGALALPADGSHGAVTEPYLVQGLGIPAVPELAEPISAHLDRISEAVQGVASGRTPLNFLESGESPSLWWDTATRDRLVAAKRSTDPLGTIRSNRAVNH